MSSRRRRTWRESRRLMTDRWLEGRPVTTALFEEYTVGARRAGEDLGVAGAGPAGLRSYAACDAGGSGSASGCGCGSGSGSAVAAIQPCRSDSDTLNHRATEASEAPLRTERTAHSTT